jgi:hypothetical protein
MRLYPLGVIRWRGTPSVLGTLSIRDGNTGRCFFLTNKTNPRDLVSLNDLFTEINSWPYVVLNTYVCDITIMCVLLDHKLPERFSVEDQDHKR